MFDNIICTETNGRNPMSAETLLAHFVDFPNAEITAADMKKDYYIPQDSDWHRKNQGSIFKHNGDLQFMTVTDRAIYFLNQFGIKMTENEYIGLRLTDGLYEEANKNYYVSYIPERQLKSNIAYILHQADSMATHIEYDEWKRSEEQEEIKVQGKRIMAYPNAGMPRLDGEMKTYYTQTPKEMANHLPELLDEGAYFIGGCCGTTPAHIKAFRKVLDSLKV